ncbi:PEX21-like protein [Saccharomyces kudriavzevii IFO 1802]|uniref:PEX21-like protein n=1 Tax=Saccharomyces kudriavzevii (strain ATCC MYA-4449 / AS 2.2408 / CBS 8840 / NBRC 1802 / NCYC 2889) TaxID=226230 RepID=J5RFC4_SACK1|nr:PEX21-like protein [Saccharomyces kudriavzevii IFO 1802]
MPSTCRTSPVEQVIQKGQRIQNDSLIPSKPTRFTHREFEAHYINNDSCVETSFLHHAGRLKGIAAVKSQNQPSSRTFSKKNNYEESSNWVPQFSSMNINDPLEFTSEYKKLYFEFESQQRQNSSGHHYPIASSIVRKTTSNFQPRNTLRQHLQGNRNNSTDEFKLDAEFQNLESEIQEMRYEPKIQEEKWQDQDQLELQRIATEIVECCATPPSSVSSTSTLSSIDSKLSESKFIQLMRGISSGDVTLRKEASGNSASELFHRSSGEIVGNKHISVKDQSHEDVYN